MPVTANCIFCKIISGNIPSHKVMESNDYLAFLGILPKYPGMTVIVTKNHTGSYIYNSLSDKALADFHIFAKKVAEKIDKGLGSIRCIQVMEGFDVDHAHLKLFPVYEGKSYGVSYEGTVPATNKALDRVAKKIRAGV